MIGRLPLASAFGGEKGLPLTSKLVNAMWVEGSYKPLDALDFTFNFVKLFVSIFRKGKPVS
jgi:hypothetical protein